MLIQPANNALSSQWKPLHLPTYPSVHKRAVS